MFTRHHAALREEQIYKMSGIKTNEHDNFQTSVRKSTDRQINTSDEEILTEYEDHFNSYESESEQLQTTQRVLSPQVLIQSSQTAEICESTIPLIPTSVNRKHRAYTKKRPQSTITQSQVPPQAQGDMSDKDCETVNQNHSYLLDNLGQMINGAFNKMTETLGTIFRNTATELTDKKNSLGSKEKVRTQSCRTRRAIRYDREQERESGSDSDSDDNSSDHPSSVPTNRIFTNRSSSSPKLPAFKGEQDESWKAYINRFEAVAIYNSWIDREKLGHLLPRLQGTAGEFAFEELSPEILTSYRRLKREPANRFGIYESRKTFQTKFRRRDQKNGESTQAYGAALKSLYSKAYPKRDSITRQEDLV